MGAGQAQTPLAEEWKTFLRKEIVALRAKCPSWFAGGFGNPAYVANFKYWVQMESLSLHEALLVSVGVEPKHISENALNKMRKEIKQRELYPSLEFLVQREAQFQRRFSVGYSGYIPMHLFDLKCWFETINLDIHADLEIELESRFPAEQTNTSDGKVKISISKSAIHF